MQADSGAGIAMTAAGAAITTASAACIWSTMQEVGTVLPSLAALCAQHESLAYIALIPGTALLLMGPINMFKNNRGVIAKIRAFIGSTGALISGGVLCASIAGMSALSAYNNAGLVYGTADQIWLATNNAPQLTHAELNSFNIACAALGLVGAIGTAFSYLIAP